MLELSETPSNFARKLKILQIFEETLTGLKGFPMPFGDTLLMKSGHMDLGAVAVVLVDRVVF